MRKIKAEWAMLVKMLSSYLSFERSCSELHTVEVT